MVYIVPKYVKNLAACDMFQHELEKIRFPMVELTTHVTIKTTQLSIITAMLAGTVKAYASKPTRNFAGVQMYVSRYARVFPLGGLALGPLMVAGVYFGKKLDRDGLYDRCYRLRHNNGELRRDRASLIGLSAGYVFSRFTWGCPYFACTAGMCIVMGLVGFWQHKGWFDNKLP